MLKCSCHVKLVTNDHAAYTCIRNYPVAAKLDALEDENEKLVGRVDELEDQLQQHMYRARLLTLLPPTG